jgi:hypothetical protein
MRTQSALIGVGRAKRSPSLRTGRADLPHPALQSVVLPPRGLTGQRMGSRQGEQAQRGKESIQSRQHPFRPDRRFHPSPASPNLSGGFSPCSRHCVRFHRSVHPVSNHLRRLRLARARYPSAGRTGTASLRVFPPNGTRGFAFHSQAHHLTPAVSSSSSYGLAVHLLLLPTAPCDDAVAVGYKLRCLGEDFHLSDQVRSQAHECGSLPALSSQ